MEFSFHGQSVSDTTGDLPVRPNLLMPDFQEYQRAIPLMSPNIGEQSSNPGQGSSAGDQTVPPATPPDTEAPVNPPEQEGARFWADKLE